VDLDGYMFVPVPATGLKGKPYLMLGQLGNPDEDPNWAENWAHLDGWKRWLSVDGANHGSFTDNPVFYEKLDHPQPPGTIAAARGVQLTRQYVAAFFDLQLKGISQPILDGPTAQNPEVVFHQ